MVWPHAHHAEVFAQPRRVESIVLDRPLVGQDLTPREAVTVVGAATGTSKGRWRSHD